MAVTEETAMPAHPQLARPARPARRLPLLEMLRTLPKNSLGVFDEELYDELFVVRRYGLVTVCFVSDPVGVKQVLVDNFDNYPRLPTIRRLFEAEIGTGTLGSEGEVWARHRRVATPAVDPRALKQDIESLIVIAEAFAEEIADRYVGRKKPVDMQLVAADVLTRMMNEIATKGDPDALPVMKWLSAVPRKPRGIDVLPKPEWLSKAIVRRSLEPWRVEADRTLRRLIDERLKPDFAGPKDLLWRLANTPDRQTGKTLPPQEARDEAASLLAAGDATIRALSWIWYLLALHPDAEAKLHAEVDALGARSLEPGDLRSFDVLGRTLDEVMRLYPPIPVMVRRAKRADEVCGRRIPKGAFMVVSPFVIHRHRALWDEPERFDPDRFASGAQAKRPKLAYLPFAVGPRVCPGSSVSSLNLTIAVAAMARKLKFTLAAKRPIVPFGAISLEPLGGMMMRMERR